MKTIIVDMPYSNPSDDLAKHIENCDSLLEALKEFAAQLQDAAESATELAEYLGYFDKNGELEQMDLQFRTKDGTIVIVLPDDVAEELGEEICEELEFCEFE